MADEAKNTVQQEALNRIDGPTASGKDVRRRRIVEKKFGQLHAEGAREVLRKTASEGFGGISPTRRLEVRNQFDAGKRPALDARMQQHHEYLTRGFDSMAGKPGAATFQAEMRQALEASVLGDTFRDEPNPTMRKAQEQSLLRDPQFRAIYQERLNEVTDPEKVRYNPKKEDIDAKINLLRATDPTKYPDDKAAEADARVQLKQEWDTKTAASIDNVMGDSVNAYMQHNLELAQKASDEGVDLNTKDRIKHFEGAWNQKGKAGKDAVANSFEQFVRAGGEGILGSDAWGKMTPEEQLAFEQKFGEKIMVQKMMTGKLSKDDARRLVSAEWMGADFPSRVDKVQQMFESMDQYRNMVSDGQLNGIVNQDTWTKIKAAGPYAAAGLIAALLAALAAPVLAPITVGTALTMGATAAGGVGAFAGKLAYDSRNDAA